MSSFFFFKQKTAYEMRISDWSSDVCSSDLVGRARLPLALVLRNTLEQRNPPGRGQVADGALPLCYSLDMNDQAVASDVTLPALAGIAEWLEQTALRGVSSQELIGGLGERMGAAGIPLSRLRSAEPTSVLQYLMRNSY